MNKKSEKFTKETIDAMLSLFIKRREVLEKDDEYDDDYAYIILSIVSSIVTTMLVNMAQDFSADREIIIKSVSMMLLDVNKEVMNTTLDFNFNKGVH